jgi:hypothetical protein
VYRTRTEQKCTAARQLEARNGRNSRRGGITYRRGSQGVGVLDVGLEQLERVLERPARGGRDHLLLLFLAAVLHPTRRRLNKA